MNFSILITLEEASKVIDQVMQILRTYESVGSLLGILLPFIEAFLPFLPLFAFVIANSVAYGV